jgi:transposase InsO family protein
MEYDPRTAWALWRYGILGPLVSARLEHGDRRRLFREAASRVHVDPEGCSVRISPRTVEAWFYAWKHGGLEALKDEPRSDKGASKIPRDLQERLLLLKRENPRRSARRLIRILERAGEVTEGQITRSSVQRLLLAKGVSRLGGGEPRERRSFRFEEPGALWIGDVLHGPLVLAGGRLRKTYVIAFIDSATRFVPAAEVRLSESAADHEYVLKQAILKHGIPGAIYEDNGAAQRSESLVLIVADLSSRLIHTESYDPQAKGVIERWNRTFREEVESELPEEPIALEEFQSRVWSWLAVEYNARVHDTTGRVPLEHWLSAADTIRPVPPGLDLDEVFLHRERRRVRGDGTVRFRGGFLEVHYSLVKKVVELRFDPFDAGKLPRVFQDGKFICDTVPLDPFRNALRRRHRGAFIPEEKVSSGLDPLGLMQEEHLRRARPPEPGDACEDRDDSDDGNQQEVSNV